MSKRQQRFREKAWKNGNETRFTQMVAEYHAAKETLDSIPKDTAEYNKQKKHCDTLFASAERFFTQHQ